MSLGTLEPVAMLSREGAAPLPHWKQLAREPEEELGRLDVAFVQFVTNTGLLGSERLDIHGCMCALRTMADRVREVTAQRLPRFHRDPVRYENSEAYFRALCLATVLQTEFGVRYDPAKVSLDVPFEVEDTTVQGIVLGQGGTCVSLPVLYASVGRHLGYPIKLVHAHATSGAGHCFARWDGDGARFNIETTATGLASPPDDHYRTGRYHMIPEVERVSHFLRSLSPRQELAGFLRERGWQCQRVGKLAWGAEAFAWSLALDPQNAVAEGALKLALNAWRRWTRERTPPGFPEIVIGRPRGHRFFPEALPPAYEHDLLGLQAVENLLLDVEYAQVWERMRRGQWRGRGPNTATIDYRADGTSEATVELRA